MASFGLVPDGQADDSALPLPDLHFNLNEGSYWGPDVKDPQTIKSCLANILKYPFQPSMKPDKLGRVCDFTFATYQKNLREGSRFLASGFEEEMEFVTVDSRPLTKQRQDAINLHAQSAWSRRKQTVKQSTAAYQEKHKQEEELMLGKKLKSEQKKQLAAMKARFARINARHRTFTEWSVQPTPDWSVQAEIPLNQLPKQYLDSSQVKVDDLCWRGSLRYYDKQADRITPKCPLNLQQLSYDLDYYWVSTQNDELIKEYLLKDEMHIDVAATDQILACLMSAAQSKYSWHLNIVKVDNRVIFDKSDGSIIDLLTVNETALEPPMQDAENKFNRPAALGFEAVRINQNIREQCLMRNQDFAEKHQPPPFVDVANDNPASGAVRYRMFTLPGSSNHPSEHGRKPIRLVTRAEVHSKLYGSEDSYVAICALNEYDLKAQKNWRAHMENQKGALLATEIRNNACKLKKFVATAMIGGCDDLKLGFVSRKFPNDNEHHVILSLQSYKTKELGVQIGLKPDNAWGIIRAVVDTLMDKPGGSYVLLKDPMKSVMRLYSRPDEEEDDDVDVADVNQDEE